MKRVYAVFAAVLIATSIPGPAPASPTPPDTTPPKPLAAHDPAWARIQLKLDVRNLITEKNQGAIESGELTRLIDKANRYWSQCSIQFVPRAVDNVNVLPLNIPYEPQNQGDLSKIAAALNPNGSHGAIPFTVAGPWRFVEQGMLLYGLGWVFVDHTGKAPSRIGAMIGAQRIKEAWAGQLAAHELGHALSLGHDPRADNVMAGGSVLTREQCTQARGFTEATLAGFFEKPSLNASL